MSAETLQVTSTPRVVAICASGPDIETALVAERFARCACFHLHTRGSKNVRVIVNQAAERAGGAAAAAVALLSQAGVEAVLGRRFGAKAIEALREFEISERVTELACVDDVAQWVGREWFNEPRE